MSTSAARYFPGAFGKGITSTPVETHASQSSSTEAAKAEGPGQLSLPSDEALMAQICEGSREALAILFRRYARLVRTVAMRILRDDSESDDLLQDVFLFVHRNCSIFDSSRAAVRSWIVQMTYHRAIDRRRYLNSRHFYTRLDLDGVAGLLDPRSESGEDRALFGSLVGNTTFQGLLDALTEDQRNTLSLHFFDGYTFAEIAAK